MGVQHRVGFHHGHLLSWLAELRLLRQHANTTARQILNEPPMECGRILWCAASDPSAKRHPGWLSFARRSILRHFSFHFHSKRLEAETDTRGQLWTRAVLKADLGRILVVSGPVRRVVEVRPHLSRSQASNDDLVGNIVVGGTGQILVGPVNVTHAFSPLLSLFV